MNQYSQQNLQQSYISTQDDNKQNGQQQQQQQSQILQQNHFQKKELSVEEQIMQQQISPVEDRALAKVFERLCNATSKNYEQDNIGHSNQKKLPSNQNQYQKKKDGVEQYFTVKDLQQVLSELEYPATKQEMDQMIWEIDEKLTGRIYIYEFYLCYKRCSFDKSGLEPRSLYNVVQFLMYLTSNSSSEEDRDTEKSQKKIKKTITSEDTLELLYVRYGRTQMNFEIEEIFGPNQQTQEGQDVEISLEQYLSKIKKKDFLERQKREKERKNVIDPTTLKTQY